VRGQGCAVTLLDERGEPLRPAIIWMDSRSEPQCELLRERCAELILQRNGKQPAPYNADPVLLWLQAHEPAVLARASTSLTTTGYLNYRLCGRPVENLSDASILFAFDLAAKQWSEELITCFELPRRLYPPLAACQELIGELTPHAAAELGLRPGIPIVAGGEDTASAGLAIGVARPGQALLSLGTAGTLYVAQEQPTVDPRLLAFLHVLDGQTLIGGSMAAVGAALEWCRSVLGEQLDYDGLTALAAQSEPGAGGVLFLPYLSGELQPINDGNARGVFFGLSLNTERSHLARAVMEGAAFAMRHNLDIARQAGASVAEIRAVGGPTRSRLWSQIIADVTGCPLLTFGDNAGAPLGNALLAAAGVGLIADPGVVAQTAAQVGQTIEPNPATRERYDALFGIYQQLYPALKLPFAAAARILW
jgi:xylulokinase